MLRSEPEPRQRAGAPHRARENHSRAGRRDGRPSWSPLLRKLGVVATQSSVSRDLRELGVAKLGDRYVLPAARPQRQK